MLQAVRNFFTAIVCLTIVLFFAFLNREAPLFDFGDRYTFCVGFSSQARMIVCDKQEKWIKLLLNDVGGESTVYIHSITRHELEQKYSATLLFSETCADEHIYYYRSPCFSRFVELQGERVNLQIVERNDAICVGTPIIFGGF